MSERFKELVLKTSVVRTTVSSNLTASVADIIGGQVASLNVQNLEGRKVGFYLLIYGYR